VSGDSNDKQSPQQRSLDRLRLPSISFPIWVGWRHQNETALSLNLIIMAKEK